MFTIALTPARITWRKPSGHTVSYPAALISHSDEPTAQPEHNATPSAVSELVAAARALAKSANESVSLVSAMPTTTEMNASWTCSPEEDVEMAAHWYKTGQADWRELSVGILQLVHGDDEEFRAEADASQDCIRQTFDESIPRTAAQAEEITCTPKQHGTTEEMECWNALMRAKFSAVRESPYDITILLDTDVFANPSHNARATLGETLKSYMAHGGIDILAAHEASQIVMEATVSEAAARAGRQTAPSDLGDYINLGTLNGGILVVRKSPITDRFFACADRYMAADTANHDQRALNTLLGAPGQRANTSMRSVTQRTLPPEWMCRLHKLERNPMLMEVAFSTDEAGAGDFKVPCVFVHSRRGLSTEHDGLCPLR